MDPSQLPDGWSIDSDGYFYLANNPRDYWEVRAGCLLRHHVVPRRHLFRIHDVGDAPIPVDGLDLVRSTLVHHVNGGQQVLNDDGLNSGCPSPNRWTGITVFQISGATRKELGMTAYSHPRQVAKEQKVKNIRTIKKDKDKNSVSERTLDVQQRELFQAAKVKELKSFFENGVWEFQTTREADPARTLSSRMLLKWAKNPDGTPRAKARLIVRGYSDIDALEGRVQTDSPTTSRFESIFAFEYVCPLQVEWVDSRCRNGISTRSSTRTSAMGEVASGCLEHPWSRSRMSDATEEAMLWPAGCSSTMVSGSNPTSQRAWTSTALSGPLSFHALRD